MYKKILVPLDGTAECEAILPEVIELASDCDAEIYLLRVVMAHSFPGTDPVEAQLKVVHKAEEYIEKIRDKIAAKGIKVQASVRYGHDIEEILDHCKFKGIDLIALSHYGGSGLRRLFGRDLDKQLLREVDIPVIMLGMKQAA